MKPIPLNRLYNNVQTDFQWRRRCNAEEASLLQAYSGPKRQLINDTLALNSKQRFYPNGALRRDYHTPAATDATAAVVE